MVKTIATTRRGVSSGDTDQAIEAAVTASSRIRKGWPISPRNAGAGRATTRPTPRAYMGKNMIRARLDPVSLTAPGRNTAQGWA